MAAGNIGYGYYTFVDDELPHAVLETICVVLGLCTGLGLFVYAVRRDGLEAGTRSLYVLLYLLVPTLLGYLFLGAAGRLANVWLDFSAPRAAEYVVLSKGEANERRFNQVKPAGRVRMQRRETGREIVVPMRTADYNLARVGDAYRIVTKTGAFGREWILSAKRAVE